MGLNFTAENYVSAIDLIIGSTVYLFKFGVTKINFMLNEFWPSIKSTVKFFILDSACKWVMAVESEDKYAYKGFFIAYQGVKHGWQEWPAYKNKQDLIEYPSSFDFTKNEATALLYAYKNSRLPDTQDVIRERVKDFPVY